MPISTIGSNSLNQTSDLTINGQTVGKGGGNVATNTAHGVSALNSNTTAAQVTAFGYQAAYSQTNPDGNSAFGYQAMYSNATGANSVAIGRRAAYTATDLDNTVAVGAYSLTSNTTGDNNTAIGKDSLYSNTTASNNTAVGYQALYSSNRTADTAANNTAIGFQAGYSSTTSTTNTFIGIQAGFYNTTGNSNVMIGSNAGALSVNATTGDGNVYIGGGVRGSAAGNATEIVIGYLTTGKGSSTGFINPNSGGVYQGNNSSSWSTTSDQRLKKNIVDNTDGLNKITAVRVRNFEYRLPEEVEELDQACAVPNTGVQLGVIAQELQAVVPECVKEESTGVLSVDPDNLTWYMVNAIQELKSIVDAQAAEIAELKAKVAP